MNTTDLTRRLSAIFSADVQGYSRLMRDDEEATVQTITSYRTAMTHLIQEYRGRVVDSPGDNILAEFTSVVDAVNCGVEIQRELAERNAELPENRQMQFRIGINLGDVLQEGDRIYGDGVNIAARIESLAEAGGISISGTVYDAIENKIGLEYEYLGEQEVKNIDKPVRVYRVLSYPGAAAHRVLKAKRAVGKTWRNVVLAIVAVLILGGGTLAVWHFYFRPPPVEVVTEAEMAFPLPDKPSIGVLPFVNVSGDPEQDYIADGITEQIITTLARNPHLFVIASNSMFTYKGKPVKVQQVSRELGVRYVVEGSVQKSGDRIRITAQLIDATTGKHIWAKTYDRDLKDIFAVQDEIAIEILKAVSEKLMVVSHTPIGTNNVEAYLKLLKANMLCGINEADTRLSRQIAEESIALDPEFAAAYGVLGHIYNVLVQNGWSKSPREDFKKAFELAQKSIDMDEALSGPHSTLGWIYFNSGKHEKAIAEMKRAIALDPNNIFAYATLGNFLAWSERPEEAISVVKKAARLNPFPTEWQLLFSGHTYYVAERYEEALSYFKKLQKKNPDNMWGWITAASIYGKLGREKKARAAAIEILRLDPKFTLKFWEKWPGAKNRERWAQWIDGLRKAGLPDKPPMAVPEKPSIAVLPFANISGDPKEDYLSDGITEQIITALSKTPKMLVIARNSSFTYKGKPVMVQQVSKELGVRYVLEGSVQRSGDRLRVTAQLIDATTGNHLWAEQYDRSLKDVFALQDEITLKVITALQVKLTKGEIARMRARGTDNLEAFLKVSEGLEYLFRFSKAANLKARQLFEEAIALDPNYAYGHSILGHTYTIDVTFGWSESPKKALEKAFDLAQKAISLDDGQENAHRLLGNVYLMTRQPDKAMAEYERAIAVAPNNPYTLASMGDLLVPMGRFREAIKSLRTAIRLDPFPPANFFWKLTLAYIYTGRTNEAIEAANKAVNLDPGVAEYHFLLGNAFIAAGKSGEALAELDKALSLTQNPPSWHIGGKAVALVNTGKIEEAVASVKDLVSSRPDDAWGYMYLASVLCLLGRHEEALQIAQKTATLQIGPYTEPHIKLFSGLSYGFLGQYDQAILRLKEAIKLWPDYVYGHIDLAANYTSAGRLEEARVEVQEILKINPTIALGDIAKNGYFNFRTADKDRILDALRNAGLK